MLCFICSVKGLYRSMSVDTQRSRGSSQQEQARAKGRKCKDHASGSFRPNCVIQAFLLVVDVDGACDKGRGTCSRGATAAAMEGGAAGKAAMVSAKEAAAYSAAGR